MNLHTPLLRDALAAEYVLGTLHGLARRRFERLLPAHPALQRAVADWERRLNRLAVTSPSVSPSPQVWRTIEQRLFPTPPRQPWWDSLLFWRGLALAGVLMAVIAVAPRLALPPQETESAFAMIRGKQQEVLWTVALADDDRFHTHCDCALTASSGIGNAVCTTQPGHCRALSFLDVFCHGTNLGQGVPGCVPPLFDECNLL